MSIFEKKLNWKGQPQVLVVNAPDSFEPEIAALEGVTVQRAIAAATDVVFVLAFVIKQADVDAIIETVAPKMQGDAILWFVYPKASSKKYKCEFNRDTGWAKLGQHGFEPVRQVAIDEDWSALRFRRVEYIKKLTRHPMGALTEEGKARTSNKPKP